MNVKSIFSRLFCLVLIVLMAFGSLISCTTRPQLKGPETAMRWTEKKPILSDDLPVEPLLAGIQQNLEELKKRKDIVEMTFGPRKVLKDDYVRSLEYVAQQLKENDKATALQNIRDNFYFFEIYGDREWGEVFMTSYYDSIIEGSYKKTDRLTQPLYKTPEDMVTIKMDAFFETFPHLKEKMDAPHEQKSQGFVLRGRVVKRDGMMSQILPYYSREEIDSENKLNGQNLEIVWVDPIKSFVMQIQGSGLVRMPDGKMLRVGYAAQNGHPYVAIGKFLLDVIPLEKMSMQAIESHLRSLPPQEMQAILNKNPSYVFFRELDTKSITYFGTEVVSGRTIATDYRYFPKGALAYLEFESPQFADNIYEPESWRKTSRIVIDQDTGGAIRGAHRLDLYWGVGEEAEKSAGVMRRHGKLYYLVPTEELLQKIAEPVMPQVIP